MPGNWINEGYPDISSENKLPITNGPGSMGTLWFNQRGTKQHVFRVGERKFQEGSDFKTWETMVLNHGTTDVIVLFIIVSKHSILFFLGVTIYHAAVGHC